MVFLHTTRNSREMGRRITLIRVYLMLLIAVVLCVLMVTYWIAQQKSQPIGYQPKKHAPQNVNDTGSQHPPDEKLIIFHLDLKGAPPKLSYLFAILPLIQRAGANAILLEYEDTFPWNESLKNASATNAYTMQELTLLVNTLTEMQFEVIPLVQTFGHLEFILKLEEFRHLREMDPFPQEVCPSKPDSFQLIKEMVHQIMNLHKHSKFIHIGCDEVYHLAGCPACSRKTAKSVFSSHVKKVAGYVKMKYPGVKVIIWDDMLRKWSPVDIAESQLGDFVEPMVWVYIDDIPRLVPHFIWYIYKKTFPNVWGASAFKGAFGERQVMPDLARHFENNLAWQNLLWPKNQYQNALQSENLRGLAITGWSRYDHFAVLSELLPVSLPSLVLSLTLAKHYQQQPSQHSIKPAIMEMFKILHCPQPYPFKTTEGMKKQQIFGWFGRCKYPGSHIYQLVSEYNLLQARWEVVAGQKDSSGWLTEYNQRYKYSSPYRLLELFPEEGFAAQRLLKDVVALGNRVKHGFQDIYHNDTIDEWIEQHLDPIETNLKNLAATLHNLMEVRTWGKRPP